MVYTKIRFIMIFASEGGEAVYSQLKKKKDLELTEDQITRSLLKFILE